MKLQHHCCRTLFMGVKQTKMSMYVQSPKKQKKIVTLQVVWPILLNVKTPITYCNFITFKEHMNKKKKYHIIYQLLEI